MITSTQNEQVKKVVSLHSPKGRTKYKQYLIEGKRLVQEAFLRKAQISEIYYTVAKETQIGGLVKQALSSGITVEEVSETVMKKMSATESPQGILALIKKEDDQLEDIQIGSKTVLLIIDGIQDPGNLGTILRTALSADVTQIFLTKGTVDLYNPKVLRSSMGSVFAQKVITEKTPEEITNFCNRKKCMLVATTMEGNSIFQTQLSENYPLALIVGNEGKGVSDYFQEKAEKKLSIPMFNNVESLNVAIATSILLYELRRQVSLL